MYPGNLTVLLIKPEGMKDLGAIKRRIPQAGLKIIQEKDVFWISTALSEDTLRRLYPDASDSFIEAAVQHFRGHATRVLMLSGENAINKMFLMVGNSEDPWKCRSYTIRAGYRRMKPVEIEGGIYYKNGVYCPSNVEAMLRALQVLFVES